MHLLCRADAGPGLGAGHVVRALALVEEAQARGWQVTLAGDVAVPWLRQELDGCGVSVIAGFDDAEELESTLLELDVGVVVVDHYALPSTLHGAAAAAGALLVSVEDFEFGRRPADVVVNYHVGSSTQPRPEDGSAVVLLGPAYAPLRPGVASARRQRSERQRGGADVLRALVAMGGTDATGATGVVLEALAGSGRRLEVSVVGGSATGGACGSLGVRVLPAGQSFPALLVEADIVVCAAGVSTYEAFCVGVPTALVTVADNQVPGYRRLLEQRWCHGLGSARLLRDEPGAAGRELRTWLDDDEGRAAMAERAGSAVDGRGCARILDTVDDMAG